VRMMMAEELPYVIADLRRIERELRAEEMGE
jgi:hypothetical protein